MRDVGDGERGSGWIFHDEGASTGSGLSRSQWQGFAEHLVSGATRFVGDRPWRIAFPGPASVYGSASDGLEGFARILMVAGFAIAQRTGSVDEPWYPILLEGLEGAGRALAAGAEDAWPGIERVSQPLVEAASVAVALMSAPAHFWDPLSDAAKSGLRKWMLAGLAHSGLENNWMFFPAVIAAFFECVEGDRAAGRAARASMNSALEEWYLGDGWYSDGPGRRVDYYNAWGFHYYPPLIAHFTNDSELRQTARERIDSYLASHRLLIDPTGAPVYFGRSLTYRFGVAAPFFSAALVGADAKHEGLNRLIASRTLRYFVEHGALADGALTVGWHDRNPAVTQDYSSGGSPLWAGKAFVGLLLSTDAGVWSAPEPSLEEEAREIPEVLALSGPELLLIRTESTGVSQLISPGGIPKWQDWTPRSRDLDVQYARVAYSSVTAPRRDAATPDNTVHVASSGKCGRLGAVVETAVGENWIYASCEIWDVNARPQRLPHRIAKRLKWAKGLWAPRLWRGSRIQSITIHEASSEYRVVRVVGAPSGATVSLYGYAAGASAVSSLTALGPGAETIVIHTTEASDPFGADARTPGIHVRSTVEPVLLVAESRLARSTGVPDNGTSGASIAVEAGVVELTVNTSTKFLIDFESPTPVTTQVVHEFG